MAHSFQVGTSEQHTLTRGKNWWTGAVILKAKGWKIGGKLALVLGITIVLAACGPEERIEGQLAGDCSDAADNDLDGLFDCADSGCVGSPDCQGDDDDDAVADPSSTAALWLLDEGPAEFGGWTAVDASGGGHHGALLPAFPAEAHPVYSDDAPFPAPGNYSVDLSGTPAQRIEVVSAELAPALQASWTLDLHFLITELAPDQTLVGWTGAAAGAGSLELAWLGESGTLELSADGVTLAATAPVQAGEWHHAAIRCRAVDEVSNWSLLLDGAELTQGEGPRIGAAGVTYTFGNRPALDRPLRGRLDEIRLSTGLVPDSSLGNLASLGQTDALFGESFETFEEPDELWNRGGPYLNQWRRIPPPGGSVEMTSSGPARSGSQAVQLTLEGDGSVYNQAFLYYRMPLQRVGDATRLAFDGWVSFDDLSEVRLFFLNEVFTGRFEPVEPWLGHSEALLAGGIQYEGRTQTWQYEHIQGGWPYIDFSEPIDYSAGLDLFHYFRMVVDYGTGTYESFTFDDQTWDLSGIPLIVFEPDTGHDITPPMFEFNVRLISFDDYEAPYSATVRVDDFGAAVVR